MKALKFAHIAIHPKIVLPKNIANKQITKIPLDLLNKFIAEPNGLDIVELVEMIIVRRCRKCGCTERDCSQCIEKTGDACHWVEADLCSACVPSALRNVKKALTVKLSKVRTAKVGR